MYIYIYIYIYIYYIYNYNNLYIYKYILGLERRLQDNIQSNKKQYSKVRMYFYQLLLLYNKH